MNREIESFIKHQKFMENKMREMCGVPPEIVYSDPRRTGRTTRLVDGYIQKIFKNQFVVVGDHHQRMKSHERVARIVRDRLRNEHGIQAGIRPSGKCFEVSIPDDKWNEIQDSRYSYFKNEAYRSMERIKALDRGKEIAGIEKNRDYFRERAMWWDTGERWNLWFEGKKVGGTVILNFEDQNTALRSEFERVLDKVYPYPSWHIGESRYSIGMRTGYGGSVISSNNSMLIGTDWGV